MNWDDFVERARNGDKEAENELLRLLAARFMPIAERRLGGRKQDAEDVVQEACKTISEKYKTETFHTGFIQWAYGVVSMKVLKQSGIIKRDKAIFVHLEYELVGNPGGTPEGNYEIREILLRCLRKILKVRRRYARVLVLKYQGFDADEIASHLGITKKNLWALLSKARRMLRVCLETEEAYVV